MADWLLTSFVSLVGIKRSCLLEIEMMSTMVVCNDDDLTHGDDVDPEESPTHIEWTVINPQAPVSCLYQMSKDGKKMPVNV